MFVSPPTVMSGSQNLPPTYVTDYRISGPPRPLSCYFRTKADSPRWLVYTAAAVARPAAKCRGHSLTKLVLLAGMKSGAWWHPTGASRSSAPTPSLCLLVCRDLFSPPPQRLEVPGPMEVLTFYVCKSQILLVMGAKGADHLAETAGPVGV